MSSLVKPTIRISGLESLQDSCADLFESGILSDAEVHCGNRTWKIHKAIVCIRSEWFKKALMGHFEESRTGIVKIETCTEDEVDLLLNYLYTGVLDPEKYLPGKGHLASLISVWKVADFFCMRGLRMLCLESLDNLLMSMVVNYSMSDPPTFPENHIPTAIEAVRLLYEEDRQDIRDIFRFPFLAVLLSGVSYFAKNEAFNELVHEIPEFASDWVSGLMAIVGAVKLPSLSMGCCSRVMKCGRCQKHGISRAFFDARLWFQERIIQYMCRECISVPTWDEWVGEPIEDVDTSDNEGTDANDDDDEGVPDVDYI